MKMFLELLSTETSGGKHIPVYQDFKAVKPWVTDQLSFHFSSWHISHSITAKRGCDTKPDTQLVSISYLQINNRLKKLSPWSFIHKAWNHHASKLSKTSWSYFPQAGCLPWLPICLSFSSADWHTHVSCFLSTLYCTFWENHLCVSMWSAQSASPDRASDNTKCIRNQINSSYQNT